MANARDIKKRIKAVGNIKRITKTMQMIATSKFARAQHRATATKPYTEGIFDLVTELAQRAGNISHPLIDGPAGGSKGPEVYLILTSDRGLCGPYNGNVIRLAMRQLRAMVSGKQSSIEVVGRKGLSTLKFNNFQIERPLSGFGDATTADKVDQLANDYMERFTSGKISGVKVVYMRFISTSRQRPEVLQLLPLKPPAADAGAAPTSGTTAQYEFSPNPEQLLADLLPEAVKSTLFQSFNDAIVSEHVARMIAMKAATDNAGKMGKNLSRKYNRARQAQITTELTEIISGSAALS